VKREPTPPAAPAVTADAPKAPEPRTPTPPSSPVKAESPPAAEERETKSFVLENLEQRPIELKPRDSRPTIGGSEIQVIEYNEANSGLRASTPEGTKLNVDGMELYTTELSIEPNRNAAPLGSGELAIESFWAVEAFTPTPRGTTKVPRETTRAITPAVGQPPADAPPPRQSALDALRVEETMPVRIPTPPSVRIVTPSPRASASVSADAPAMPPVVARTPAALEAIKEMEPWAFATTLPASSTAAVAEALERVARRIRNGEVRVRADGSVPSDETALAAALQALGRLPRP
jgi:hypothetical protein